MRRPAMVTTAIVYSREEAKKPEDNSEEEMEGQFRVTSCGRRASNNQHPPFMNVCACVCVSANSAFELARNKPARTANSAATVLGLSQWETH